MGGYGYEFSQTAYGSVLDKPREQKMTTYEPNNSVAQVAFNQFQSFLEHHSDSTAYLALNAKINHGKVQVKSC